MKISNLDHPVTRSTMYIVCCLANRGGCAPETYRPPVWGRHVPVVGPVDFIKPTSLLGVGSLIALGVIIDCPRNVVCERVKAGHHIKMCPADSSSSNHPRQVGSSVIPIKY